MHLVCDVECLCLHVPPLSTRPSSHQQMRPPNCCRTHRAGAALAGVAAVGLAVAGLAAQPHAACASEPAASAAAAAEPADAPTDDDKHGDVAPELTTLQRIERRTLFKYEKRLRKFSTHEKMFEYFSSKDVDGEPSMSASDVLRALLAIYPPDAASWTRCGSLPGERSPPPSLEYVRAPFPGCVFAVVYGCCAEMYGFDVRASRSGETNVL